MESTTPQQPIFWYRRIVSMSFLEKEPMNFLCRNFLVSSKSSPWSLLTLKFGKWRFLNSMFVANEKFSDIGVVLAYATSTLQDDLASCLLLLLPVCSTLLFFPVGISLP